MNLKEVISHKIYDAPLSAIAAEKKCIINAFNPHSYIIAKKDKMFEEALLSGDVLLPDGVGIVFAARFLKIKTLKKIAGADIHSYLLIKANEKGQGVFYVGTTESTVQIIEKKVKEQYPNVRVGSYCPPFAAAFSGVQSDEMIEAINNFKPEVLFVGMTAPKQEMWVHAHKELLKVHVIACIGAVFDFYAGTVKRPGPFWIKLGLEWFIRLLGEPKRLWKRNFVSTPLFLWDVFKEKFS